MSNEGENSASLSKAKRRSDRKLTVTTSEIELLREISTKLDRVVAVLAAQGKERDKQIEILSAAGCDSALVGTVVGLTASAVRVFQSRQRIRASALGTNASAKSE